MARRKSNVSPNTSTAEILPDPARGSGSAFAGFVQSEERIELGAAQAVVLAA